MSPHTVAIVSHLTIFGLIYAMVKNHAQRSELGAFYIRQSLGITLLGVAGYFIRDSFGAMGGQYCGWRILGHQLYQCFEGRRENCPTFR